MRDKISALIQAMIHYDSDSPERINHFLKVFSFAKSIGEIEGIAEEDQMLIEAAAIVHDIGIKLSLEKYQSSAGPYQELEGPPIAKEMLGQLGFEDKVIERVCFLVAHHHTYNAIDHIDYQILVEADFLVNIFENDMSSTQIKSIRDKYFKTKTGLDYLETMYLK